MIRADKITVDDDEGRICLVIDTDDGDKLTVDIHGIALEFYAAVRREIGPYAQEAALARATMPAAVDDGPGYAPDDPKHPTYYERMVD